MNNINYIPYIIHNLYDVENNTVEVNHHSSPLTTNIHFNTFVNQCENASPRLNILYVITRGFSKYKQKYIFNCLLYIYDIIFIRETWFINYIELFKNPHLLASTPIKEKRGTGYNNGIMCFINPLLKENVSILQVTEYYIILKIFNKNIMAVYFPPSLSSMQFKKVFQLFILLI